jgi:DNA recombination protein RmuC
VLGDVKAEFVKFGEVIEKVEKKLSEASTQLQNVHVRSRALQRKLKDVQALPAPASGGQAQPALPSLALAEPEADEVEAV